MLQLQQHLEQGPMRGNDQGSASYMKMIVDFNNDLGSLTEVADSASALWQYSSQLHTDSVLRVGGVVR